MAIKEHFEGKRDLGLIDPRKLSVDPGYNVRDLDKPEARDALDYLKSLVKATGVQIPLRIREDGDNLFIVRGHRRHKVVMELIAEGHPIKLVPVTQEPRGTTPAERNWDLIDSNSEEPLKGFERADALYRQIHTFGWSEAEILKRTGKTQQWLNQQLELRTVSPEVKAMVDRRETSLTTARQATREHGEKAAEVLRQAKDTTPSKRATPKAVARVTGKRPSGASKEDKDRLLDFVSVAGKIADEAKRVGGIERIDPAKLISLSQETVTTLAKAKGEKVEATKPIAQPFVAEVEPQPSPPPVHPQLQESADREKVPAAAAKVIPYLSAKVDALLSTMIICDVAMLARKYAQLVREREASASEGNATPAQEQLCVAADVIGALRFPDDWEQAKGNTELDAVA